jgi:hypothetical protein
MLRLALKAQRECYNLRSLRYEIDLGEAHGN